MSTIFHALISKPLYNGLIFLISALPFLDMGVIIIIFTVIVKIILLPLSVKASKAQIEMRTTEKDLNALKEKYKDNKEQLTLKTMEYYKEKGINPFAGFIVLLVQLPILIGLYNVFIKSGLPLINSANLYSFISLPAGFNVNMVFLHLINISEKSLILAIIAGLSTYVQISLATPKQDAGSSIQNDMAKAMATQMKYFFPILISFIAYSISGALALYLITSNIFAIGQEMYIQKKYHKSAMVV